jgi:hypothetical protein
MGLRRLQGAGVPRMPPLATSEIDPSAVALLTDWINSSLPSRQNLTQWQTQYFGSPAAPNAALTADPDGDGQTNVFEFLQRTLPTTYSLPPPLTLATSITGCEFSFVHPANRSAIVETSANLLQWRRGTCREHAVFRQSTRRGP